MVLMASVTSPSCSSIGSIKNQVCQLHSSLPRHVHNNRVLSICSENLPRIQHFQDPSTKLRVVGLNYTKDKLWEFAPGSVKQFPWKKAESVALQEVVVLGKETLKWTVVVYFAFSFLSDFIHSISRNKELVIPFGLFIGCLMANYFDEISQEFMLRYKDGNSTWLRLLGMACFFVLVKIMSTYFSGGRYFLLHAADGGLMQVIWKWNKLPKQGGDGYLSEDVSNPMYTSD